MHPIPQLTIPTIIKIIIKKIYILFKKNSLIKNKLYPIDSIARAYYCGKKSRLG